MKKLSIIIVNYNVQDFLMHTLESIKRAVVNISHEIFVVDNASVDGSVEMLKNKFPGVILMENKINKGFAAANNQAMKESTGEFIVLINPDTVVQEDTFTKLLEFMENHPDAGAATCKILNPDGTFSVDSRHSIPTPMTALWKQIGLHRLFPKSKIFARYNLTYLDENKIYPVDAISGSFMFIRHSAIEEVGYLDEDYFMYCEDVDYCYRITRSGWKVYYAPVSDIIHYKGESTKKNNLDYVLNFNKSLYLFYKKHFHKKYFAFFSWIILLGIFFRGVFVYIKNFFISHFSYILDVLLINTVILSTFIIRYKLKSGFLFEDFLNQYIVINLLATAIFSGVAFSIDLYRKYKFSLIHIFKTNFATFFILSALTFFLKQFAFSRIVVVISAFFSTIIMILWRFIFRRNWKGAQVLLGQNIVQQRTVLVGTDDKTSDLVKKVNSYVRSGLNLVGLISLSADEVGTKIQGVSVVTTLDKMKDYIKLERINQIIFSTHSISYEKIIKTMSQIGNSGVDYKIVPQNLEVIIGKSSVEKLTDYQLVDIDYAIGKAYNRIIKRLFDILFSVMILLPTSICWIVPIVLLRWRKSYVQIWGENGERCNILQFKNNIFKGFLNKLLLAFYIFTGHISFVGAPLRLNTDAEPNYFYKPGIFGLTQLNRHQIENITQEERYDLFYLKNQSIWLDLEIILKSLFDQREKH
jgi:GT2 family glycosyltransferase/lipopolysaccharide/colanic/teichoic acid biosynthesis glycosyltransferase